MRRFYLNNYKWLELLIALIAAIIIFIVIRLNLDCSAIKFTKSLLKANDTIFAAIASLLGFVFATITILVGLGDNFRSNDKTNILTRIIERIVNDNNVDLSIEESKEIKNKHSAASLFFSTSAYPLTLKSLMGCVSILGLSFILSLIVTIFGKENIVWATIVSFYVVLVFMSIIRILVLIKYMIEILTNPEESDK